MSALGKVVVLGAGNIGGSLAQRLAEMNVASEVTLVDIIDGLPARPRSRPFGGRRSWSRRPDSPASPA
jgi:3-hydroxyacyl-CoA dehydrogenase